MSIAIPVAMQWSGGKDSGHALGRLLADDRYDVRCLVSSVHAETGEASVHDVPAHLLQAQADAIALPLRQVALTGAGLGDYEEAMSGASVGLRGMGIRAVAFGDLDHSGALRYREQLFAPAGLDVVEPLAGMTSRQCIDAYLQARIDAVPVVVNADVLGQDRLGVPLDRAFVDALPDGCDPCGEYGEYHTFVWNAPYFRAPVRFAASSDPHAVERRIGTSDGVRTFRYWRLPIV